MKSALLVIDYINGIVEGSGSCAEYLRENPHILANTNLLIRKSKELALPVIFIRLAFDEDYNGLPKYSPISEAIKKNKKFLIGSFDVEFINDLDYKRTDVVLDKKYGDPFYGSNLLNKLRELKVEDVIFTGVATDNGICQASCPFELYATFNSWSIFLTGLSVTAA